MAEKPTLVKLVSGAAGVAMTLGATNAQSFLSIPGANDSDAARRALSPTLEAPINKRSLKITGKGGNAAYVALPDEVVQYLVAATSGNYDPGITQPRDLVEGMHAGPVARHLYDGPAVPRDPDGPGWPTHYGIVAIKGNKEY